MSNKLTLMGRAFYDQEFIDWFNGKPEIIQDLIHKCPPGSLMINKTSNHLMEIYSWLEDGTVTAVVYESLNHHVVNAMIGEDYRVFGIPPEDLDFYCFPDDKNKIDMWIGSRLDQVAS